MLEKLLNSTNLLGMILVLISLLIYYTPSNDKGLQSTLVQTFAIAGVAMFSPKLMDKGN